MVFRFYALALCVSGAASVGAQVVPPTRDSLAGITQRGQMLASYDSAAWVATDGVLARQPSPDEIRGYLAFKRDGEWVVTFGRMSDDGVGNWRFFGTSLFLSMEETKVGRLVAPVSVYEGNVASGAIFASDKLMKTDPAAIRAFLAAWVETADYMRAHKAETVKITSRITHFSEAVMAREYDLTIGMHTHDCRFDKESLDTLRTSFVELKLLPSEPDMSKLYTEAYVPKKK